MNLLLEQDIPRQKTQANGELAGTGVAGSDARRKIFEQSVAAAGRRVELLRTP